MLAVVSGLPRTMSLPQILDGGETQRAPVFATTHWSVVLAAGQDDTSRARDALERLCRTYWFPLYAYVRRHGYSPADAEDLTQGFFERLLRLDSLSGVRREKGRFRSFLLGAMNHFLRDEWARASAQRRDAQRTISLDAASAETRYQSEQATDMSPGRLFDRQWAMTVLETTLQRLREQYATSGRDKLFLALRFVIAGEAKEESYARLAADLGMTEDALRVAIHRLRRRYREMLRAEIAGTVAEESEIAEELNYLRQVLAS